MANENDLTRALRDVLARCASGEPDYFVEVAANMVRVDRRRSADGISYSGEEFDEAVGEYYHAFGFVHAEPIAVRGQRLALVRLIASVDQHEFNLLCVYEAGADGRLVRCAMFDNHDLKSAHQELDERCQLLQASESVSTHDVENFQRVSGS